MERVPQRSAGLCPLCGRAGAHYATARDIEYFTTDQVFDYHHCAPCDVIYVDPMLEDQLGLIYPANYYSFDASARKKNLVASVKEWLDRRAFRRFLAGVPGGSLALLDIGGGEGWLAGLARAADPRVTRTQIVDIDPAAKARAEAKGHSYFCGTIGDFETEARFDAILMLNLIEHVADPAVVLAEARSLLSPRGRIFIKTPNHRALDARLFRRRNWGGYHCPRHFVLFSRASMTRTLEAAGLCVAGFSFTQGAPFWSVSVLELMRRAGFADVSAARPAIRHPFMPMLQAAGAAFDFARMPFAELSQMTIIAERDDAASARE
jgi:SAM-dependent methyltransferase